MARGNDVVNPTDLTVERATGDGCQHSRCQNYPSQHAPASRSPLLCSTLPGTRAAKMLPAPTRSREPADNRLLPDIGLHLRPAVAPSPVLAGFGASQHKGGRRDSNLTPRRPHKLVLAFRVACLLIASFLCSSPAWSRQQFAELSPSVSAASTALSSWHGSRMCVQGTTPDVATWRMARPVPCCPSATRHRHPQTGDAMCRFDTAWSNGKNKRVGRIRALAGNRCSHLGCNSGCK
jgi:hypothetical protein